MAHVGQRMDVGDITVDGEPTYPTALHPKYVAVGMCKGFCLGKGH